MDENELKQIAQELLALAESYEIPVERLSLLVQVSKTYYEDIKQNFPRRGLYDMTFMVWQDNWDIVIGKPFFHLKKDNE